MMGRKHKDDSRPPGWFFTVLLLAALGLGVLFAVAVSSSSPGH